MLCYAKRKMLCSAKRSMLYTPELISAHTIDSADPCRLRTLVFFVKTIMQIEQRSKEESQTRKNTVVGLPATLQD